MPCLIFIAIVDARIGGGDVRELMLGTVIQISCGLGLGWLVLRAFRLSHKRELVLPIAFVNSANIPFPLVLANFGADGLSRAAVCYIVTSFLVFTIGVAVLHGAVRWREALQEPTVWAAVLAALIKVSGIAVPEALLSAPRLASTAAVPTMLIVFGDSLARTELVAFKESMLIAALRYATGAVGLALTLALLHPVGIVRKILILYALLPPAVVNVVLARRAGHDAASLASAVLLATLASIAILPIVLSFLR